jgi:hypothetical protein
MMNQPHRNAPAEPAAAEPLSADKLEAWRAEITRFATETRRRLESLGGGTVFAFGNETPTAETSVGHLVELLNESSESDAAGGHEASSRPPLSSEASAVGPDADGDPLDRLQEIRRRLASRLEGS